MFILKFIRLFTFGFLAVILVVYLNSIGLTTTAVGYLFSLTLLGDAAVSLLLTSQADIMGRKLSLVVSSLLSFFTGLVFATQNNFYLLLVSAIIGVISPSGNEIGPFLAIELACLSEVVPAEERARVLAWYNLTGTFATAFGALFCGLLVDTLHTNIQFTLLESYQTSMIIYSIIQIGVAFGFYSLSSKVEVSNNTPKAASPGTQIMGLHKSKWIIFKICMLFMLDAFAGSFVLQSLVSAWFHLEFDSSAGTVGAILFFCNIVAGVSALFAVKISESLGVVMTMIATNIPANILLILVPLMPSEFLAILLLVLRFSISQMDVPLRNAYVCGVVDSDERSAANGLTNTVRSIGASTGPIFAGYLLSTSSLRNEIFYISGGVKLVYDLFLYIHFGNGKVSEDRLLNKMEEKQLALIKHFDKRVTESSALILPQA